MSFHLHDRLSTTRSAELSAELPVRVFTGYVESRVENDAANDADDTDAVDAADAATANRLPCVRVSNNVTGTCQVTARRF